MTVIVVALAVWRLSSVLAREDGPWLVFERLRYALGVRYDDMSKRYGENVVAEGIICTWCNSVWLGILAAIGLYFAQSVTYWVCVPLAFSAVAIIIDGHV